MESCISLPFPHCCCHMTSCNHNRQRYPKSMSHPTFPTGCGNDIRHRYRSAWPCPLPQLQIPSCQSTSAAQVPLGSRIAHLISLSVCVMCITKGAVNIPMLVPVSTSTVFPNPVKGSSPSPTSLSPNPISHSQNIAWTHALLCLKCHPGQCHCHLSKELLVSTHALLMHHPESLL